MSYLSPKNWGRRMHFFHGLSVLDVLGQYFYFSRRHKKTIPDYRELTKWRKKHPESIKDRPFDIIPSARYGWPNELAYKIWTVYEKKLSDSWGCCRRLCAFRGS